MLQRNSLLALVAAATTIGASLVLGQDLPGNAVKPVRGASSVRVGDFAPPGEVHLVSHPGRYGLGPELPGSRYGVIDGLLVRIDPKTMEIQSVIRMVSKVLD